MKRYFEYRDEKSAKFWEIALEGSAITTRYGKIGTTGQSKQRSLASPEQAQAECGRQVREKRAKGYREIGAAEPEPATAYLENPQTGRFFEASEDNNHLRIRRGAVGRPCLVYAVSWQTAGRGREHFERLVKEWKEKGFELTQPNQAIVEGSKAGQLWTGEIDDHPVYERFFDLGWASELRGQIRRLIHFPESLSYDGDFDLEEIADMGLDAGLIIEGDVRVSGVFSQLSYIYPGSTLITGNVYAHSLGHKDSFMRIDGDVRVENVVYGEYNDGSLQIGGDVYGAVWISADHDMWANGNYFLPRFNSNDYNTNWKDLSPKILDLEGRLDWDALREFLFARKSPLRKGFVFTPPEPEPKPVAEQAQTSELYQQVRRLAEAEDVEGLTQLLETWPDRDAEWMEYVRGRIQAPSSTPEQKERLRRLLKPGGEESATISAGQDEEPDQITQIESFAACHADIKRIVEAMKGEKGAKRTLKVLDTPMPRELFPPHSHVLLINALLENKEFPNCYLPVIERLLDLGADPRLPNVEGHSLLDDSLVYSQPEVVTLMQRFDDATPIWQPPAGGQVEEPEQAHPKIRELLDLLRRPETPDAQQNWELILALLQHPPERELILNHSWILLLNMVRNYQQNDNYISVIERLLELGAKPHAEFEGMNMGVVRYAEILDAHGVLELFYKHYSELRPSESSGLEVLEKLLQLEAGHADVDEPEDPRPKKKTTRVRNALKRIKQLNEEGNRLQTANPPEEAEALAIFEQVLDMSREFLNDYPDDFVGEYLFALQAKLWCVNELVSNPSPPSEQWTADRAMQLAREILNFAGTEYHFYYSSMGELSRSAQTLAHNTLAWYLHERGENQQALEHANAAVEDIDYSAGDETYGSVLENKVRILLALDRRDEAYATVYQMHRRFPELRYFKELSQSTEFQQWNAEN